MIRGSGIYSRKILLILLFLSGVTVSGFSQGRSIGGVINEYMDVVSVSGSDNVTLSNAGNFHAGDTVLLIQMKGAVMLGPESNEYGTYQYSLGTPGAYEFLVIQSVISTNIVFTRNLVNTYNTAGHVQLIKVPSYNAATVTSELTCLPWDSVATKTGGVLAMIVSGTLTLDADINVSGKGLIGGVPFTGDGLCLNTNTLLYDKYAYPYTYTNSGYKGESHVSRAYLAFDDIPAIYPDFAKGKGANFTGGGGGNGRFSGGGGGASIGAGGKGGRESGLCGPPGDGGLGGKQALNTAVDGNMLLGGGGGSSTSAAGSTASAGGRGGGIIIIVCDNLKINGIDSILAHGSSAAAASGNAGAGGGGGGGSIALYQQNFLFQTAGSELEISANGGNGGNSTNNNGEGGGGGGGLVLTNLTIPAKVTVNVNGGIKGTRTGYSSSAFNGASGKSLTTFNPLLNGFLFNTIWSDKTKNQVDSVCSNMMPPLITGTRPVGGLGSYTYLWEQSTDGSTNWVPAAGTNTSVDYQPPVLANTLWFRRVVMDAGPPAITDISKAVEIIVHPGISNNTIGNPDTFCQIGNPDTLKQAGVDLIVPSTRYLFYTWQDSTGSAPLWNNITGFVNTKDSVYLPPALTATTSYRRIVISASCIDTSKSVRMTILPGITGNAIFSPADDSICSGMDFEVIPGTKESGTTPLLEGGDDSYTFKWESNNNYSGWITALEPSDRDSLNPAKLPERIPWNDYVYRRIVYSGMDSACKDTSNVIILKDFPKITTNNIYPVDQTICSGSDIFISGNLPNNGNNLYTWQDSTNSTTQWEDISGFVNVPDLEYQSPVLTQTTSYRRIAYSYGCSDTSNATKITIQPPITGNDIFLAKIGGSPDTTICSGQTHNSVIGTVVSGAIYQWFSSTVSGNLTPIPGATQVNYPNPPPSLNVTTLYKRLVTLGACSDTSSSAVTISVLPPVSNNVIIPGEAAACENAIPEPIAGSSVAGGSGTYLYLWEQSADGGTSWAAAEGTNTLPGYQPPVLANTMSYRRNVFSADCMPSVSPAVDIIINPAPLGPVYAGEDESIFSIDTHYNLNADPPVVPGETGSWTVLEPGSAMIVNDSDSKSEVRNLSAGRNLFVWSVTNGLCNIYDSVYIELLPDLIPQGFSPNGDAWNNEFIIEGLNLSENQTADLSIINGAGTVVFTTSNRDGQEWVDWDGRNTKGNELPEGTYYYLLNITTNEKVVIRKSGFIELKRY